MLEGASGYAILTFVAIGTALFFDFVNGFHDSANAIATIIGTRVLKPLQAVIIAAFANFVGPFIFGTAIATTVGSGIIEPQYSTVDIILAGLIGATIWDLVTWYFGLPSSSSHALIGGLVGSALIVGGREAIIVPGVEKVLIFMILSPVAGFVIAFVLAMVIIYFFKDSKPLLINRVFGKLQIVSSTFFSLTHSLLVFRFHFLLPSRGENIFTTIAYTVSKEGVAGLIASHMLCNPVLPVLTFTHVFLHEPFIPSEFAMVAAKGVCTTYPENTRCKL